MNVEFVNTLSDNYAYLLLPEVSDAVAVVDPGEAAPVLRALAKHQRRLTHVLLTHHHFDHVGGLSELVATFPDLVVVAHEVDAAQFKGVTRRVVHDDKFIVGSATVQVLSVPCHTRGHVAFLTAGKLFTGDTLFSAGCGRFFEGDATQMFHALDVVIGGLPEETEIYCGHEYTEANLRFAASIEPGNLEIEAHASWARSRRADGLPTLPSTLRAERSFNPFLRTRVPAVANAVGCSSERPVEVLAALRTLKDGFRA